MPRSGNQISVDVSDQDEARVERLKAKGKSPADIFRAGLDALEAEDDVEVNTMQSAEWEAARPPPERVPTDEQAMINQGLSPEEARAVALNTDGHTTEEIAKIMLISVWTAREYLKAGREKMGLKGSP